MTTFEQKYFSKFDFTDGQVSRYFDNAIRDLEIAKDDKHNEVKFTYAFTALIKSGIALIAKEGRAKVRSVPGHHIKIIEKMSEILCDERVMTIGNAMRMKRNEDFYGGGIFISDKEAAEYIDYIETVLERVRKALYE